MARLNIKYDIKNNLGNMLLNGVGTSKHQDKIRTNNERSETGKELKEVGFTGERYLRELDNINYSKHKIYMDKTFKDYSNICDRFSEFVIEKHGTRRISVEDSKQYIQSYINKLIEDGKSASYQKKCLAAICKGTGAYMRDYYHEEVNYSQQIKNKIEKETVHKEWSEEKYKDVLDLNRCIGIRREELINLKIENITFYDDRVEVYCPMSKGGKNNINVIRDTRKIEVIQLYYNKSLERQDKYLITKDMLCRDVDLHSRRALNAREEYKRVVDDIKNNPERKDYYKKLIQEELERKHKQYDIDKLDKDYICRGKNAQTLRELDIETKYNRIGVMYVSLFCLNHYREDTTVQHYLAKR